MSLCISFLCLVKIGEVLKAIPHISHGYWRGQIFLCRWNVSLVALKQFTPQKGQLSTRPLVEVRCVKNYHEKNTPLPCASTLAVPVSHKVWHPTNCVGVFTIWSTAQGGFFGMLLLLVPCHTIGACGLYNTLVTFEGGLSLNDHQMNCLMNTSQ